MTTLERPASARLPDGVATRPATVDDLPACAEIWRVAIDDYIVPLNQPPVPDETGPLSRLHAHIRSTDPERFRVATRDGEVIAFGAAARRDRVWFLSMLFVRPGEQRAGLGRALLEELLPAVDDEAVLATATDVLQPISNALYAGYGMVPRMPLLGLAGRPDRPEALGELPAGIAAVPFEELFAEPAGHGRLAEMVDALDMELAGMRHPADHRWLRAEGRSGFLYRDRSGTAVGYGYAAASGRIGPIAAVDESLLAPIVGRLTAAVEARGAYAVWVPGFADRLVVPLLRAGFRIDGFPLLLCWSRDFADFHRYIPISPGLL